MKLLGREKYDKKIIEDIKNKSNCRILPSTTVPADITGILPDDIKEFYTLCGGIILFEDMPYSVRIVPPEEFVLANPVISLSFTVLLEE